MPTRSFDPASPGARRLAATWVPRRERWLINCAVRFVQDGTPIEYETFEVAAPEGRRLVARGAWSFADGLISAHD